MGSKETRVRLRPTTEADRAFLLRVYRSTREGELALTGWDEPTRAAFVAQQFTAQDTWWRAQSPGASFDIVVVDGVDAGRLYVDERADEVRVVDITLLPEFQRRGVGSLLLQGVSHRADELGVPVTMHVEVFNPARALYERLGFRLVGERGVHLLMARPVPQANTAS